MTYTPTVNRLQGFSCNPEILSLEDEIVASAFWNKRQPLTPSDADLLWFIIGKWRNEGMSATHALAWLENEDLLDPDALMTGFAAFHTAVGPKPSPSPTPLPPCAPGGTVAPSREVLEAIAGRRIA